MQMKVTSQLKFESRILWVRYRQYKGIKPIFISVTWLHLAVKQEQRMQDGFYCKLFKCENRSYIFTVVPIFVLFCFPSFLDFEGGWHRSDTQDLLLALWSGVGPSDHIEFYRMETGLKNASQVPYPLFYDYSAWSFYLGRERNIFIHEIKFSPFHILSLTLQNVIFQNYNIVICQMLHPVYAFFSGYPDNIDKYMQWICINIMIITIVQLGAWVKE